MVTTISHSLSPNFYSKLNPVLLKAAFHWSFGFRVTALWRGSVSEATF